MGDSLRGGRSARGPRGPWLWFVVFCSLRPIGAAVAAGSAAQAAEQYKVGLAHAKAGRYAEAASAWRAMLAAHGETLTPKQRAFTQVFLAKAYLRLDRTDEAMDWLNQATEADPNNREAEDLLVALMEGRNPMRPGGDGGEGLRRALAALTAAIADEAAGAPPDPRNLASLEAQFRKALAAGTDPGRAHFGLGACLARRPGGVAEAIVQLEKAAQLDARNPQVFLELARVYERGKKSERAVEVLERSFAAGHRDGPTCLRLAVALAKRGRPADNDRILDCARQALRSDPSGGDELLAVIRPAALRGQVAALQAEAAANKASQEEWAAGGTTVLHRGYQADTASMDVISQRRTGRVVGIADGKATVHVRETVKARVPAAPKPAPAPAAPATGGG